MRNIVFVPGEYYHLLNRGNNKQKIFIDERDYARFLFCILHFQSPHQINNVGYAVSNFIKHRVFDNLRNKNKFTDKRMVNLVGFTLMPNHFHLVVSENTKGGISSYMQRIQNAYTKYFNARYEKTGHLFQGPFKAVHVEDNEQLLHLSAYVHRNQRELSKWRNKEHRYEWSSYQDYVNKNRWNNLLDRNIILEQFSGPKEYKKFVETSGTKDNYQTPSV